MLNTFLIPLDRSTLVKNMIKKLPQILELSGNKIIFTHISEPFTPRMYTESSLSEYRADVKKHHKSCEELAKKLFESYRKILLPYPASSFIHIFDADIPRGILKVAKQNKVNMIVMASHRYTGINKALLGDKVHKVIVSSKYPVLVV